MDSQKLREELSHLIDQIKEHSDYLSEFDRIPRLELEMMISIIRKLYEKTVIFSHVYEHEMQSQRKARSENPPAPEPSPDSSNSVSKVETIMPPSRQPMEEPNVNSTEKKKDHKQPEVILSEALSGTKEDKERVAKAEINSKFKGDETKGSLNEKISKSKTDLSSKLKNQPVSDLFKAIGVNERFMFTKELFKNDSGAFSNAISRLNNFEKLEEAEAYLATELATTYHWNPEEDMVRKLYELVQRRYL